MPTRYTIQDMQFFAKQMGGKCLSKQYSDIRSPLAWMCENGHTWDSSFEIVRQGGWCRMCARGDEKKERLRKLQEIAKTHNGRLLSNEYINKRTKLKWECREGHSWLSAPNEIRKGSWCPVCFRKSMKLTIEEMYKLAEEMGGKCLSKNYVDAITKLKWQCSKGHIWTAIPNAIKNMHSWCPVCAPDLIGDKHRHSIAIYQKLALNKGGKLLSTSYRNNTTPLLWRCKEGHEWMAPATNIRNSNHWCPTCANKQKGQYRKLHIADLRKMATRRKGKLLSKEYINNKEKLLWQCQYGHKWFARTDNVKNIGDWCPACAGQKIKYPG